MLVMEKEGRHRGAEKKKKERRLFLALHWKLQRQGLKKTPSWHRSNQKGSWDPENMTTAPVGARMEVRVQRFFISRSGDQKLHGRKKKFLGGGRGHL